MTKKERLLEILETLRPKEHFYLDADPWYSCPSNPDYRGDDDRTKCTCGFKKQNEVVDEAVVLVSGVGFEY